MKDQTIEQQQLLAAYCRNGVDVEILGTTDGRLHNYRRLVFNVVRDALSSTYPLTYNLLEINAKIILTIYSKLKSPFYITDIKDKCNSKITLLLAQDALNVD